MYRVLLSKMNLTGYVIGMLCFDTGNDTGLQSISDNSVHCIADIFDAMLDW